MLTIIEFLCIERIRWNIRGVKSSREIRAAEPRIDAFQGSCRDFCEPCVAPNVLWEASVRSEEPPVTMDMGISGMKDLMRL